jgi:hypothetical protein
LDAERTWRKFEGAARDQIFGSSFSFSFSFTFPSGARRQMGLGIPPCFPYISLEPPWNQLRQQLRATHRHAKPYGIRLQSQCMQRLRLYIANLVYRCPSSKTQTQVGRLLLLLPGQVLQTQRGQDDCLSLSFPFSHFLLTRTSDCPQAPRGPGQEQVAHCALLSCALACADASPSPSTIWLSASQTRTSSPRSCTPASMALQALLFYADGAFSSLPNSLTLMLPAWVEPATPTVFT